MTYATKDDYYEDESYEETKEDFDEDMRRFRRWERKPLPPKFLPKPIRQPINIGDEVGSYIDKKANRPKSEENNYSSKKVFTEEDRRKFIEEREKHLEEVWSRKTKEELIESSIKTYSAIPMFDFGLGEKSNHQAIMDFYGHELYKRIVKEIRESFECPSDGRETGQISKELWQLLKDIRAGRKAIQDATTGKITTKQKQKKSPRPNQNISEQPSTATTTIKQKPKSKNPVEVFQRQRQPSDDYFLSIERGVIRNESYIELFKGPGTVFDIIWEKAVRKNWTDTEEYPIRKMYYDDRKLLVYCTTWRHLAKKCKMSVNTVINIVKRFEEAGVVKTESFTPLGKKQDQTVFIIGYWTITGKKYTEHFYRDEIFLSPKVSKN